MTGAAIEVPYPRSADSSPKTQRLPGRTLCERLHSPLAQRGGICSISAKWFFLCVFFFFFFSPTPFSNALAIEVAQKRGHPAGQLRRLFKALPRSGPGRRVRPAGRGAPTSEVCSEPPAPRRLPPLSLILLCYAPSPSSPTQRLGRRRGPSPGCPGMGTGGSRSCRPAGKAQQWLALHTANLGDCPRHRHSAAARGARSRAGRRCCGPGRRQRGDRRGWEVAPLSPATPDRRGVSGTGRAPGAGQVRRTGHGQQPFPAPPGPGRGLRAVFRARGGGSLCHLPLSGAPQTKTAELKHRQAGGPSLPNARGPPLLAACPQGRIPPGRHPRSPSVLCGEPRRCKQHN
ncbi:translation initiation factor IF-2-like [Cygnus atratus]|uniref:translation initiation factor IF-2-like n=1 Tax=Cygnus atratus TaxID=8868 RepID=UPI0015D5FA56|nr:translation initiation factor IF-2-like [Cygnus atratus]XP_035392707.1 translation initiation factor IF-2-like [Cygnus atratus]XP_035392708.1 translation initiation factor IF-2-like [Cygnus atratus]XP_035392709.1 translation initiation factor IF-2-like [Cygnus atratus]XP_035392710.1 translation initiation factor IF-2-like [Cygnus atratus]XP_035392711.1 translation initiation factor IF-2-like [Cygnus atratus]XP_050567678.1 translation initiation factor IF-2-like [Cygnus atratus]